MSEAWWNTNVRIPLPWVRTLGPKYWASQKVGDKHGPEKYKKLQPDSYVLLNAIMDVATRPDNLFDVGCGTGRHLKALRQRGYNVCTGMDLPDTFEEYLPTIPARFYDLVFTFGMTIELVPPDFPIGHHMARIAKKAVVLMIQERGVPYPRLWRTEFEREGLTLTKYQPCSGNSLFVFERR